MTIQYYIILLSCCVRERGGRRREIIEFNDRLARIYAVPRHKQSGTAK